MNRHGHRAVRPLQQTADKSMPIIHRGPDTGAEPTD